MGIFEVFVSFMIMFRDNTLIQQLNIARFGI